MRVLCRAYCSKADAAWPPVWMLLSYLSVQYLHSVPTELLILLLSFLFPAGMYFTSVKLAGEQCCFPEQ